MKPSFSDDERTQAVRNFVVARYHKLAKINSFMSIVPYLNEKRIKLLCPLEKSETKITSRDSSGLFEVAEDVYGERDAETYFNWLVAVVTGAESATEDIVKQANDQLFQFINLLGRSITMEKNV